jgi:hypothetical protein
MSEKTRPAFNQPSAQRRFIQLGNAKAKHLRAVPCGTRLES